MSPEENRLLTDLLDRLARLPVGYKDAEADALITAAMIRLPNAPYQLVQAYILHEQAAAQAKAKIEQLEAEVARLRQQLATVPQAPAFAQPQPAYAPQQAYAPQASPWGAPVVPRQQSFLGSVAETAAGVAGGMLLAEGVSSLFGGHHSSPWGGGGWGGGGWGSGGTTIVENTTVVNETIVNNDYGSDDDGDDGSSGFDDV